MKKLVLSLLIATSVMAVTPIGASAEWRNNDIGTWYSDGNYYYTGWKEIGNKWYNFGNDGYMRRGWIQDGSDWYYLKDNGEMVTGTITVGGKIYEFGADGKWISNPDPSNDSLNAASNFSWFNENGKTYFKTQGKYLVGAWNIDGSVYEFDRSGVMQTSKYTSNTGREYLFGDDGKFVTCTSDSNFRLVADVAVTTKSTTNNPAVKLDTSKMMTIKEVYSNEKSKDGINADGVKIEGNTLYCKTNQSIKLGDIIVSGADGQSSLFPNLKVETSYSTGNTDVAYSAVNLSQSDGFYKNISPEINTNQAGSITVTIDVNGSKTSFNVVVTE